MGAAAIPALAGAMSTAAPIVTNSFLASLAGGAATGTLLAPAAAAAIPTAAAVAAPTVAAFTPAVAFQTAASTLAPSVAASVAPTVASTAASTIPTNIFANANLPALTGTPAGSIFGNPNLAALAGTPSAAPYTGLGMAGPPPTFMQSAMSAGKNIQGLMNENPALTSVAKQAVGGMMQPPPPPRVLQAPPIQSGQFAPVDFMSLLSQKPQQMQRRTSLLG